MQTKLYMGNELIALGALDAGVNVVTGYPGTPSTEVLETIAKYNDGSVYVEWSVNEKAALEVAAGASYAGARSLVTMKQVGLNVASDPLMSLSYIGVKGGMVIVVADDPGPISSQTEQDTRTFGMYSKVPVFDPATPEEAYEMMSYAYRISERYETPVIMRPTTRICHACASFSPLGKHTEKKAEGFVKDPKWVIFPRLAYMSHLKVEKRAKELSEEFSSYDKNFAVGSGKKAAACSGVSVSYVKEALRDIGEDIKMLKIATPFPFPEKLAVDFLGSVDEILVFEELDPYLERQLIYLCGKYKLNVNIHGKLDSTTPEAGENSVMSVKRALSKFLGKSEETQQELPPAPPLPVRPPVLCAGCPHRASFYAVKQAMKGKKALFSGDIGCYTLGNAMPLDTTDTCLCMGAGITLAQGIGKVEPDFKCFSFTGDSTFFHTGIVGIANAVYNGADMTAVILDNSTTAMTGHQPNPSTGRNAMGEFAAKISIEKVLEGLGVTDIQTVDPLEHDKAVAAAKRAAETKGVSAIIYRSECIALIKDPKPYAVDKEKCIGCKKCIKELGCPAVVKDEDKVAIDASLCTGCSLCSQICPVNAIVKEDR